MELIQQEPPSIVVLDVNPPDIDGFSLCLCLRLRENYHGAIVIVTA